MNVEFLTAVTPLIIVLVPLLTAAVKKWLVDRPALSPIIATAIGVVLSLGAMFSPYVMALNISPAAKTVLVVAIGMAGIGLRELLKGLGVTDAVSRAFVSNGPNAVSIRKKNK